MCIRDRLDMETEVRDREVHDMGTEFGDTREATICSQEILIVMPMQAILKNN